MMNKDYLLKAIDYSILSCDPSTKVGCVIVKNKDIISFGYNTVPSGVPIDVCPIHIREGDYWDTKYPYMIHSEAKAIVDAKCDLKGSIMYVTLFPCNECAKLIIEAGIKELYYLDDKYAQNPDVIISKKMLDYAGVLYQAIVIED